MTRIELSRLRPEEKDALILALLARVAALEAKLGRPLKTPVNSSVPPSRGPKANRPPRPKKPRRKRGGPGVTRALAADPDRTGDCHARACAHCGTTVMTAGQTLRHAYDHLDLPPIRPVVTRVRLFGRRSPGCRRRLRGVPPAAAEALTRLSRVDEEHVAAQQEVAQRRTAFEAALVRVKGLLRDRGAAEKRPACFISYAWGVPEHERWVVQLAKDLRNAGIDILLDRWHNPPSASLTRFTDQILSSDYVVVVGTPKLVEKYTTQASDPVVAAELRLINTRLRQPIKYGPPVLPVLLAGDALTSFTPLLQDLVSVRFDREELHFVNLLDLVWRLHELPFDHPILEDLRISMSVRRA